MSNRPHATINKNLTKHVAINDAKAGKFEPIGDDWTYRTEHAKQTYRIELARNGIKAKF